MPAVRRLIFLAAVAFSLSPWASAPIALALGLAIALLGLSAFEKPAKKISRLLIQFSIVLLGFSIDLSQVARAGSSGLAFAAGTIFGTFALGWFLGRLLRTEPKVTTLLCSGTAICGGSAIAATGSVIRATEAQMSVALAAVFSLNAIALYAFPPIGHALGLTQQQFGAWAAIAIHDMSSVVGAGKVYGDEALKVATVIKLSRVLWIVPVSILAGWLVRRQASSQSHSAAPDGPPEAGPRGISIASIIPWFIALFLVASLCRTLIPGVSEARFDLSWSGQAIHSFADLLKAIAKQAMVVALLFIGSGLSRKALASVGWRPFLLATSLWVAISLAGLAIIRGTIS
ncbi:MAG: YeiH family protein [Phycisphaerales bacterium]